MERKEIQLDSHLSKQLNLGNVTRWGWFYLWTMSILRVLIISLFVWWSGVFILIAIIIGILISVIWAYFTYKKQRRITRENESNFILHKINDLAAKMFRINVTKG